MKMHLNQIAIIVESAEDSVAFYEGLFGVPRVGGTIFKGKVAAQVQALPDPRFIANWHMDDREFFQLELFQYQSPQSRAFARQRKPWDIGYSRMAFEVERPGGVPRKMRVTFRAGPVSRQVDQREAPLRAARPDRRAARGRSRIAPDSGAGRRSFRRRRPECSRAWTSRSSRFATRSAVRSVMRRRPTRDRCGTSRLRASAVCSSTPERRGSRSPSTQRRRRGRGQRVIASATTE